MHHQETGWNFNNRFQCKQILQPKIGWKTLWLWQYPMSPIVGCCHGYMPQHSGHSNTLHFAILRRLQKCDRSIKVQDHNRGKDWLNFFTIRCMLVLTWKNNTFSLQLLFVSPLCKIKKIVSSWCSVLVLGWGALVASVCGGVRGGEEINVMVDEMIWLSDKPVKELHPRV